jgi:hypothetical protein
MMDTNLESAKTVTRKWGKSLQKSCPGSMAMSTERHRALRLLAGSPLGATKAIMLAHGFTYAMLDILVRDGLPPSTPCSLRMVPDGALESLYINVNFGPVGRHRRLYRLVCHPEQQEARNSAPGCMPTVRLPFALRHTCIY